MSDQCMNCTVRGDLKECLSTDCSQHESWMTQEVMKQLKASQDECDQVYKQNNRLTTDLYNSVDKRMKAIQWLEELQEFRDDVLIRSVINRLKGEG